MIPLLIVAALCAGLIIQRAGASFSMPLEEHEEYQKGTDLLFLVFLIVVALAAVVFGLPGLFLAGM